MTNVIFNSGFIGFLIWMLLFAVSTAALAIAVREYPIAEIRLTISEFRCIINTKQNPAVFFTST